MENKVKFSEVKKVYTGNADEVQRGYFAMLKRLQKDAAAAEAKKSAEVAALAVADAVKAEEAAQKHCKEVSGSSAKAEVKAEAKRSAEAAKKHTSESRKAQKAAQKAAESAFKVCSADGIKPEAVAALADAMQRKNLKPEDLNKDFLVQYLPERFNAAQQLCSRKEVQPEDAEEVRKQYEAQPEMLVQKEEKLYIYKPIFLFTANSLLSIFFAAADKRAKLQKEAADKRNEAEKAADKQKKASAKYAKFVELQKRAEEYFKSEEAQQMAAQQQK